MRSDRRWAWRNERGQSLFETALLLALIAVVCVAVVSDFGASVRQFYENFLAAWPG